MKKSFLLLFFCFATAFGQNTSNPVSQVVNKFFEVGWKAGLNFDSSGEINNLANEFRTVDDAKGLVNGFNIGLYTEFKLLKLYIRPEVHFSKFGTTFDNITVGQSRLEAPVSLGLKLLPILSAFAGPSYRYNLGNSGEYSLETLTSESTFGLHFGTRIHLGKFGIDARIERGLSENEAQLLSANNVNIGTVDNRTTQASLGISYAF